MVPATSVIFVRRRRG